jgi:hypothetical protein
MSTRTPPAPTVTGATSDDRFVVDAAQVSRDRTTLTISICDRCTFYKNAGVEDGTACRMMGCCDCSPRLKPGASSH